jgi:hypothetical protein
VRFQKHYTREQVRALLPQVRAWLDDLVERRDKMDKQEELIDSMRTAGTDLGGPAVNDWIGLIAEFRALLFEFYQRDIEIKDIDRGLVDFPAIIGGKEVFLCWEKSEDDVEYWHDLDSGYGGREPL